MRLHVKLSAGILSAAVLPIFSGCSSDTKPEPPNILIAIGDDISYPHMGAYGCGWVKTPGFDMVASKGILFQNAYTPNAKSSPSRACFLTGRNSWQLEEGANHIPYFPSKFTTFIESLGRNGYDVGFTSKGWAPGVALDSAGNPRQMTGKPFNSKKLPPPTTGISNSDYAGNFEDFLDSRDPERPFCFWYGSYEPHRRYEYGSGIEKGGKELSDIDRVFNFWPDNQIVRNDLLDYAYEIEHFDNHLVKMLDELERRGELENTIVIVTSDNGMPFPRIKGQVYELSNHLPLAIMWGKGIRKPGRIVHDFISFIDFAPTILEIAGISQEKSGMQPLEGRSFADIFASRKKWYVNDTRNYVLLGKERHDVGRPDDAGYPVRGIVKNNYLYLVNYKPQRWPSGDPVTGYMNCDASPTKTVILEMRRSGMSQSFWDLNFGLRIEEELYDIGSDPDCTINLATNTGYNNTRRELRYLMTEELKKQGDPRQMGNGDIFDNYPYASEATRDFYNRYMRGELSRRSAGWIDSTDFER